MATTVTSTIVLLQIIIFKYTSPCKCSDSLLRQNNFNDQNWAVHKCVRRQFSVSQRCEIHRLEGHAENNLGLPLD